MKKYIEKMNKYLANQEVNYIKLHNLHWYVKGKGFFNLHAQMESLYDATADVIDDVAERILALGGSPVANLHEALKLASIEEKKSEPIDSKHLVASLLVDVKYWIKDSKEISDLADEEGDKVTADLFNGYVKEYQKLKWMLDSYLE